MYTDYPNLLFLDSFIATISFMNLYSPLMLEIISFLQDKYRLIPDIDPEYQLSTRNAIIECS